MRILALIVMAWAIAAGAHAGPSAQDRAAIAAIETRLGRAPPNGPGPAEQPITARMAEWKVPGVSIAFIQDGRVKWTRTYGVTAVEGGKPVTDETLFQAASMSKTVAAAAALRLVEQGRLDLDEDINARLKSWKVPPSPYTAEKKVTLRQLLSHTAGMTVSGFPGYAAGKPVPTVLQILDGKPPSNTPAIRSFEAPGGSYAYSGGGYTVAQLAMVEAGGRPYPELLERLILRPAGMRRSTFAQPLPARLARRAASGHNPQGAVIPGARNTYPEYAAASLWTTPSDYGRFLIALQDSYAGRGGLLRQASARTMMTPVDANYGLGVQLGRWGGRPYIQHGGSNAGFQCTAFAFLDGRREGVVIMTNGDGGARMVGALMRSFVASYGWGEPDPDTKGSPRRAPMVAPAPK